MFNELLNKWRDCDKAWRKHYESVCPFGDDVAGKEKYDAEFNKLLEAEEVVAWELYLSLSHNAPTDKSSEHVFLYTFDNGKSGLVVSVYNRTTKTPVCIIEECPCYTHSDVIV